MRNSLLALLASGLAATGAAAQSSLNVVTVPSGPGVVIPPRGAAPRLVARPPSAGPVGTVPGAVPGAVTASAGAGASVPTLGAIILPAIAAAVLGGTAAGARGGTTSGPARTR